MLVFSYLENKKIKIKKYDLAIYPENDYTVLTDFDNNSLYCFKTKLSKINIVRNKHASFHINCYDGNIEIFNLKEVNHE